MRYTYKVTLDISGSPIDNQWGSWKYTGYFDRYDDMEISGHSLLLGVENASELYFVLLIAWLILEQTEEMSVKWGC